VLNEPSALLRPSILPVLAQYYVAVFRDGTDTIFIDRSRLAPATTRTRRQPTGHSRGSAQVQLDTI